MKCPRCESARVYPSRLRNGVERLRQKLTDRQPYRCHGCDWRGWREVEFMGTNPEVKPDDLRAGQQSGLANTDVDRLDPA